jgi:hypothetical protein
VNEGNEVKITRGPVDPAALKYSNAEYLKKVEAFNKGRTCDQIEMLLSDRQSDCRQARRRFKRLIEKHWPLSPDQTRHPRTVEFVKRYEAMIEEKKSNVADV